MPVVDCWRRRRRERAITRITDRIAQVQREVEVLAAQAGSLADDADHAVTAAVVRPAGPNEREAARASSARDNHQRLLAEQRAELASLRQRRDHLLEQL